MKTIKTQTLVLKFVNNCALSILGHFLGTFIVYVWKFKVQEKCCNIRTYC